MNSVTIHLARPKSLFRMYQIRINGMEKYAKKIEISELMYSQPSQSLQVPHVQRAGQYLVVIRFVKYPEGVEVEVAVDMELVQVAISPTSMSSFSAADA